MMYSELSLRRMLKKGVDNLSSEELVKFNILNYIHMIHLNKDDFINSRYKSRFFDKTKMFFSKDPGQIFGRIFCQSDNEKITIYLFNEQGYEEIDDSILEVDKNLFIE